MRLALEILAVVAAVVAVCAVIFGWWTPEGDADTEATDATLTLGDPDDD